MRPFFVVLFILFTIAPSGVNADECIEGDCVNGHGTLVTTTGQKFIGNFKDGLRHGDGVFLLPGGRKIVGVWQENEIVEGTSVSKLGNLLTSRVRKGTSVEKLVLKPKIELFTDSCP